MKKKRNVISTAILVVLLLVGLSVMLYPTVSDWWNSRVQTRAIATYNQSVEQMDTGDKERLLMEAHSYNATLSHLTAPFTNWEDAGNYGKILDISGTGIMGYISIPKIQVELPIYHGTSAEVLNVAVGHLQGSSFPVGGENTHAVISAHRGLPSAKLFSDLDQLVEGDTFTVTILDEVLTYEVEKIFIVKPDELDKLAIIPGGDYVTLMTCTPYGVNSHRLLVRAHRVDTVYPHNVKVAADAVQLDSMSVVPFIAAPLFVGLLVFWIVSSRQQKTRSRRELLTKLKEPEKKEGD
ncbi:class C sortase [Ruminococcus sp. CAG:330]|uniref:class C sortase n=1 Tax=Ruminococcus sp. CAG:330 TaxID=1262954 RepID=UPI0003399531|nr:class C sortase [Ruminococcus sp. CAG:330]CDE13682.1 sortase family protein [Ruminococcus sp. CAG:330]